MDGRSLRTRTGHLSLLVLFFLIPSPSFAGRDAGRFAFNRLMPENPSGQSCPLVHCLIQDHQGFIWIAGPYGLARYDGASYLFFQHREDDPASLSDDRLFNVFEDSRGNIWATSDKGLDLLDGSNGGFVHFRHDPADPRSLSSDRVRAIREDAAGGLWIGTADGGVNRMDPATRTFARFRHDPSDPDSPGSDAIWAITRGRDGKIWMGATDAGLDCRDPKSGIWTHYPYRRGDSSGLGDRHYWALLEGRDGRIWIGTNGRGLVELDPSRRRFVRHSLCGGQTEAGEHRILSLCEDRDGILWVGTDKGGLFRFDSGARTFDRITADPEDPGSLSDDTVMSIIEDREGLLWFGTARGLSVFDKGRSRFPVVKPVRTPAPGLSDGDVLSFYEDDEAVLWVGTAKGGIVGWNRTSGSWTRKNLDPGLLGRGSKARVQAILGDGGSGLWIGTNSELVRCFPKTGAFSRYRNSIHHPATLPDGDITALARAGPGALWVGTRNRGVFVWDIAGESARALADDVAAPLASAQVNALCSDHLGRLWIGTQWAGLFRFDPDSGRLTEFGHRPDDPASLASATVHAVAEDGEGRIWVGTQAGPCLFEAERSAWTRPAETAGLPVHSVQAIVPDAGGDVWLSSEADLWSFRKAPAAVRIYRPDDGLQGGRFNVGAGLRLRDGEIVFGGAAGFNHFFGARIVDDPDLPPVVVTAIALSSPAGLIQFLRAPESVDIPRSRFPVTFRFSALSYAHPGANLFRVRIADEDDRVYDLGGSRRLRLETLKPGRHGFVFYAANRDGVWNPAGAALTLRVTVPFPQSWAGRGLMLALVVLPAGFLLRRRIQARNRRLLHQIDMDVNPLSERFDLTRREREILALVLQGKSNREIETALFISPKTVTNHIYNLYQKVGVRNRLGLVNAVRDSAGRKP